MLSIFFYIRFRVSGFHQIEVDSKDVQKTAFSVENGHYEFLRMPFGLKNSTLDVSKSNGSYIE